MLYTILRWFWELGQVYTMTDWMNDVREIEIQSYKAHEESKEIIKLLIGKE